MCEGVLGSAYGRTTGARPPREEAHMHNETHQLRLITGTPTPTRCPEHPAYEADYCPSCGTARVIGGAL